MLGVNIMFSSEQAIWKFSNAAGELDDWLPYAEDLIREWSKQTAEEVKFRFQFEIDLAALLLIDNLLPPAARTAFAKLMIAVMNEAVDKKLSLASLHIKPQKPGRKRDITQTFIRFHEVKDHVQAGMALTEAYLAVVEKYHKSPDTIRRDYERSVRKMSEKHKKSTGKFDC